MFVLALVVAGVIFASLGEQVVFDNWATMAGLTAFDIGNAAMTFLWIVVVVLLYGKVNSKNWLSKLAPYGRMALTNYVLQSIIGTGLLYGWGLGLIGELRVLYTFGLSLLLIVIQVWLSKIWLQHFTYGPLEWVWRSLTFFKVFPLKKIKQ